MARHRVVIPGQFTRAELAAARKAQASGTPHPEIDEAQRAHIEERWTALRRTSASGPWFASDAGLSIRTHPNTGPWYASGAGGLSIRAYSLSAPGALVYRVDLHLWGLELQGTNDDGIHRGPLEDLLNRAIAAWPAARAGADEPTKAAPQPAKKRGHEEPKPASEWIKAPTYGPVIFPGFEVFGRTPAFTTYWTGAYEGQPMTPAQATAAHLLVKFGAEVRDRLLSGVVGRQQELRRVSPDYKDVKSPGEMAPDIEIKELRISRDEHDGLAYVDIELAGCGTPKADLFGSEVVNLHGLRFVGLGSMNRPCRDPKPALAWMEAPTALHVIFPGIEGFRNRAIWTTLEGPIGKAITAAQVAAARVLATHGTEVRDTMLAALFKQHKANHKRQPRIYSKVRSPAEMMGDIEIRNIKISRDERDGLSYVDILALGNGTPERTLFRLQSVSMHGTRLVGLHEGDIPCRDPEPKPKPTREHGGPISAAAWLEAETMGPVILPELQFRKDKHGHPKNSCKVYWPGDGPLTAAQKRAARVLVECGAEVRDALLDELFEDQQERSEDPDFPQAGSPEEIPTQVALWGIRICSEAKRGIAYTEFHLDDAWRAEHGLKAIMLGARVISIGGHDDDSPE